MSSDADDQRDVEADEIALLSGEPVDEEIQAHHRSTLFEVCPFILGEVITSYAGSPHCSDSITIAIADCLVCQPDLGR